MARRIPVVLDLDAAGYLSAAKGVHQQTAAVDRQMAELDRSVDKVERDMAELSVTAAVAARQVDNFGDQARGSAGALTLLDARIKATRLSVRELGVEFASTGDKMDGRALAREESALARMERLRKSIAGVALPGGKAAADAGGGLSGGRALTNPYVLAAGATAIGLAGPALGAMLSGVIAGAIGTVGVAGGLAMAAKSPQVQSAAKDLGDSISAEFFRGGDAFVNPAIDAMKVLDKAFKDMKLPEAFAQLAPSVGIIAEGIGDLGRNLMPGLNAAFGRMVPYANVAAKGFGDMGTAIGGFFDDVTRNQGAVLGLHAAFDLINGTIVVTGKGIEFLSAAFGNMIALGTQIGNNPILEFLSLGTSGKFADRWQEWIDTANQAPPVVNDAARGIGVFGEAATEATIAVTALDNAVNKLYHQFLDTEAAEVAAEGAIDALSDSLEKNGYTWDKNTQAGRENVLNAISVARTAEDTVRAILKQTGSVDLATSAYDKLRQEMYDSAIQLGATKEQAQALVDKWLALSMMDNIVKDALIRVEYRRYTTGSAPPVSWGGGFQEFASGGTTPAFEPFKVGERGEEWMFASQEHFIANKQQMQAAVPWGGGSSGGGASTLTSTVVLDVRGGDDELKRLLRKWVRIDGAGSVQTAFGKN